MTKATPEEAYATGLRHSDGNGAAFIDYEGLPGDFYLRMFKQAKQLWTEPPQVGPTD